jgi:release factor glutamine methyltransferase
MSNPLFIDPESSTTLVQRQLAQFFAAAGSETGMIEARMILCTALGIDHLALLREADRPIGQRGVEVTETIVTLAMRRARHEPVSRILGRREFFGLHLAIDPFVLDPRADTETAVEMTIDAMAPRWKEPLRILDLGTGSGAILCALLMNFPHALGLGVDISERACQIAARNLRTLGLVGRGAIVCGNWAEALSGPFDVIISNPPYIARGEIAALRPDVRDFDPPLALDGGADGYAAYRAIIPALPQLLAQGAVAVFELGQGQDETVGQLLNAAGLTLLGTREDLAGITRAIAALQPVAYRPRTTLPTSFDV